MHRLAGFTGLPAQILKIVLMALADASLVAMFFASLAKHGGLLTVVIAIIFIALNIVYFSPRSVPLKFLLPGLILLVTFVIVPVAYTIQMSAFNYRTGNEISRSDAIQQIILHGSGREKIAFRYPSERNRSVVKEHTFEGVIPGLERRYRETDSQLVREELAKLRNHKACPSCEGTRLRREARHVKVDGHTLYEISALPLKNAQSLFDQMVLKGKKHAIAEKIIKEI